MERKPDEEKNLKSSELSNELESMIAAGEKASLETMSVKGKLRKVKRNYIIYCLGVVLLYSGYFACVTLQTSINVEAGLGSTITSVIFGSQAFFSMTVAPLLLRIIGARKTFLSAECGLFLFVIANCFKEPAVLIVGALCAGYGNALFWIPIGMTYIFYGKKQRDISGKSLKICIMELSGIFFALFEINNIVGNVFSSVVLSLFGSQNTEESFANVTEQMNFNNSDFFMNLSSTMNATTLTYSNVLAETEDELQYCGANDCQNPNITQSNINQYVPKNPVALYALIACFMIVMLSGLIIHFLMFPEMPLEMINATSNEAVPSEDKIIEIANDEILQKNTMKAKSAFKMAYQAIKDTATQLMHPKQLLLTPISVYFGITLANAYTELPRSFVSCVLGVNEVGISIIVFAAVFSFGCSMIGKFGKNCKRYHIIGLGFIVELAVHLFCLLWIPNRQTSWSIYIMFSLYGFSCSVWQIILATRYSDDFYKTKEVSYNIWNITFSIGFTLLTGISTSLCMREKIYIQIGILILSVLCYGVLERLEQTQQKRNTRAT